MSNILEVDESIINKNLLLPENIKQDEDLNSLLKSFESPVASVTFKPFPGLCIKAKTDSNDKVFINLCHTSEIPPPVDITDQEFHALLDEDPPSWSIPMSVGYERFESAKDGIKCPTYDIAINTNYFNKCQKEKHFLTFTIWTILSAIEAKYNKTLNAENYVVLKNRKVTGTLHEHRVEKREAKKPGQLIAEKKKPLIEEICDKKTGDNRSKNEEESFVLLREPKDGQMLKSIGYFKLPNKLVDDKDIKVEVNQERVVVGVDKFHYLVDVFVPFSIKTDKVVANYDPNLQVLRLDMPVQLE
ncbi:PIH1 domain-containing protein 1-like [Microplitis demolitor]|uniref:PIH1 domain-containing protein 1-like n=1 Tax=Microplitis demolitor TaxID=69319 RepID=UPI0004CD08D5|nr:PIH1 domain-containing protein 1-like [Microplitis demolitor]